MVGGRCDRVTQVCCHSPGTQILYSHCHIIQVPVYYHQAASPPDNQYLMLLEINANDTNIEQRMIISTPCLIER